ncbi:hypothetical protein AB0G02_29040, partial [Actinosynnema sp. NPDC023658]
MPGLRRSALIGALLLALGACTAGPTFDSATTTGDAPSTTTSEPPAERVYISLGDSYATGYRPAAAGAAAGTDRDGFAYLVAERSDLRLVNLACSGATSVQLRTDAGCEPANRGPDAPDPTGRTQLDAAVQELRENE